MTRRPLLGSPLKWCKAEWEPEGETPAIKIIFLQSFAFELANDDPEFKKSLKEFLGAKLEPQEPFRILFDLDSHAASLAQTSAPATQSFAASMDEIIRKEPIIKRIQDLFEGRLLN